MFRQRIPQCTCQLFPSADYQGPKFRSPPSHINRQQVKSKRSLKSQSNSRNKHGHETNILQEKAIQLSNRKLIHQTQAIEREKKFHVVTQIKTPIVTIKIKKVDTLIKTTKENMPFSFQTRYNHARMISPAHGPTSRPTFSRIGSNFRDSQLQEKVYNINPISIGTDEKINCQSTGTTLAGSVAPSIEEIETKQKSYCHSLQDKELNYKYKEKEMENSAFLRNQIGFGASRLSQMMNTIECQSVYDGDKTLNSEKIEQSRVLISCKKLMQEKNGFLGASDQNKLFDFYKESNQRNRESGIFSKLTLVKPSSN